MINLVTTDVTRIFSRLDMYTFGLMGPLEVLVGGYSAYVLMGNGALIGLAVAALMQPIAFVIGKVTKQIDEKLQKTRDRRVMLLSEAIRAIRMIKYEAWEDEIGAKIMLERRAELKCQAQSWIVYTFFGGLFALVPMLTIVVAFSWYTLVEGNRLTASVAFPAVAVLVELRFAVSYLPSNFLTVIQGWVSLKRIAAYMETGEVEIKDGVYRPVMGGAKGGDEAKIELRNAEITWPKEADEVPSSVPPTAAPSTSTFTLSIPDASFQVGEINLVCGKIGSGKTLLLLSLLGEAKLVSWRNPLPALAPGSIALCLAFPLDQLVYRPLALRLRTAATLPVQRHSARKHPLRSRIQRFPLSFGDFRLRSQTGPQDLQGRRPNRDRRRRNESLGWTKGTHLAGEGGLLACGNRVDRRLSVRVGFAYDQACLRKAVWRQWTVGGQNDGAGDAPCEVDGREV